MLLKKLGTNAVLPMLCKVRFSKSFQSDNYVYYDLSNNTSGFLSCFIEIVFKTLNWYNYFMMLYV